MIEMMNKKWYYNYRPLSIFDTDKLIKMEKSINFALSQIGVPCHIKGRIYLENAIFIALTDISMLQAITKELYPQIAKINNTNIYNVERNIRHAIFLTCQAHVNGKTRNDNYLYFQNKSNILKKPTNKQFISMVLNQIDM